jgi:acyl-CoA synthetase (AMP-forming)/AMP-acid ligase II
MARLLSNNIFKNGNSMLLADFLKNTANRTPSKCPLIFDNSKFLYKDLDTISDQIARSLIKIGIKRRDRVALFLKNCPELVFSYYACFKIGAIAVPLNYRRYKRFFRSVGRDE